jgi:hypothetical protein
VKCDHLLVEQQDAEQRIAELERQLADAKAATGNAQLVRQPQFAYGGQGGFSVPRRRRAWPGLIGVIVSVGGSAIALCVGCAAAVTALIPSSALWMSPIGVPWRVPDGVQHVALQLQTGPVGHQRRLPMCR